MTTPTKTGHYTGTCKHCNTTNPPQTAGQPRKFCSDQCRSDHRAAARRRPSAKRTLSERLHAMLQTDDATGCIEFIGYRNVHGYGVIRTQDGSALAHRVTWSLTNGTIPEGLNICHHCDNPACCNIDHLFMGTHQDNMDDRDRKGRTLRGAALRKARWGR